jgi:hypothetical protein
MVESPLTKYQKAWPVLFHVTPVTNLDRLRATHRLESAAALLEGSEHQAILSHRRLADVTFYFDGFEVTLRSQSPLHESDIELTGGWSFADYLRELNSRVFFWPGTWAGPNPYGCRHRASRVNQGATLLKMSLQDLLSTNSGLAPHLSRFNTGAARQYFGRRSPRGPETFIAASDWRYAPSRVAEVSFVGAVNLPDTVEFQAPGATSWTALFQGGDSETPVNPRLKRTDTALSRGPAA